VPLSPQRLAPLHKDRRASLALTTSVAVGVLVSPSLLVGANDQPWWLVCVQILVAGILLGFGRQGVDLLLLRVAGSALVLQLGWYAGGMQTVCSGPLDCYVAYATGFVVLSAFSVFLLALVAVPASLAWTRTISAFAPELPWRLPKRRWQTVAIAIAGGIVPFVFLYPVFAVVPWPA
jgi:hypothetical protein